MENPPESNQPATPQHSATPAPAPFKNRPTEFHRVTVEEVDQQCQDLRTLLNATFVVVLVLSMSVNLFLVKQMRQVRARVSEARPVVMRMQGEFQKKEPNIKNFVNALLGYAATDREFQPVLARYREVLPQYLGSSISINSAPGAPAMPSTPAFGQPAGSAPTPAATGR